MKRLLPCLLLAAAATADAQTFTVSATPVVQIGSDVGPEYQFNRIQDLRRLSDGRIVVTLGPDIRFFDPAGKYLGKAGGRGQGPGEFQYVNGLEVLPGDTLLAMNVRTTAQHAIGIDRVYVGDNDSPFIEAFTLEGKSVGRFTVADKPTPVTAEDLAGYKQMLVDWATQNRRSVQLVEQDWADTPKPARFPYWGNAIVDAIGVLWVSGPQRQDKPTPWNAFDRIGRRVGSIALPATFTVKDIGVDTSSAFSTTSSVSRP